MSSSRNAGTATICGREYYCGRGKIAEHRKDCKEKESEAMERKKDV
jgi:hypothetical protein